MTPLDEMYQSFALFASAAAQRNNKSFHQMSAGANWLLASPAVIRCLHAEIDSALTYRNYGRSVGLIGVTTALEIVEQVQTSGQYQPSVTVTNGTTEGVRLVFELLTSMGRIRPGDTTLMVGHGFPLYGHLSLKSELQFREVLGGSDDGQAYLPSMDRVVDAINREKPKIVFLIVPNNPIGECYAEADLQTLARACSAEGVALLVDRVCLLPWDDYSSLGCAIAPLIQAGNCFVVDSFSKSESLAGIRTGFLVSNAANRDRLVDLIRPWWLNPIVFSTMTLAFSRLAAVLRNDDGASDKATEVIDRLRNECPGFYAGASVEDAFFTFQAEYERDTQHRRDVLLANYRAVMSQFSAIAVRPMRLDAGFNVAVSLPRMCAANERHDQEELAMSRGVGVLTEACFRSSPREHGTYFVRLGLALPSDQFRCGLEILAKYYS